MLVLKGSKAEVFSALKSFPEESVIFLKTKPSIQIVSEILNRTKVQKILVSPKLYERIPKRALAPLEKIGVQVEVVGVKRGRPFVHAAGRISVIGERSKAGKNAYEIAGETGIPLRTVYYHLRKIRKQASP